MYDELRKIVETKSNCLNFYRSGMTFTNLALQVAMAKGIFSLATARIGRNQNKNI